MADARLYVIPGSHPCRTGMLLLEHKQIPYRRVELVPGFHSVAVKLLGFPAEARRTHQMGEGEHKRIARADRLGTVPALRYDGERVQTCRAIARFLEDVQPDPPLFPADPERREAVEEAELWGDEVLQMRARRLVLAAAVRNDGTMRDDGETGRLGRLLFKSRRVRKRAVPMIGRHIWEADDRAEREMLAELPALLDRVDAWIEGGVLNGEHLYAADYMIASSLALLTYRTDVEPEIASRPAAGLVDRVLPSPKAKAKFEFGAEGQEKGKAPQR
jgi:glutathione S-transferase